MAPYPTKSEIQEMFEGLASGNNALFFDNVVDNVDWTVMGHSPMGGNYRSKQEFQDRTMGLLNSKVLKEKLTMKVRNVVGGGEDSFAAVELEADSMCKNGLAYDMRYCWVLKFNQEQKIEMVRAYLDTDLLTRAVEGNRS